MMRTVFAFLAGLCFVSFAIAVENSNCWVPFGKPTREAAKDIKDNLKTLLLGKHGIVDLGIARCNSATGAIQDVAEADGEYCVVLTADGDEALAKLKELYGSVPFRLVNVWVVLDEPGTSIGENQAQH